MNGLAEADWRKHLEACVSTACLLEATARKPGNVHPEAAFDDLCYDDFVRSAQAVAPVLAKASETGVGQTVLDAVQATRAVAPTNTNLGIVLLLAPLAAVPEGVGLVEGVRGVLAETTSRDAVLAYLAIRAALPGGMGQVDAQDLSGEPTGTLVEVMRLAADRDSVAAQYANGFDTVLRFGAEELRRLAAARPFETEWEAVVIGLQLRLLAQIPDTLIARKRGRAEAVEASRRAAEVVQAGEASPLDGRRRLVEFDSWLRAEGHSRNPGTTADLVTACLFAALRDRCLRPPLAILSRVGDGPVSDDDLPQRRGARGEDDSDGNPEWTAVRSASKAALNDRSVDSER